MEYIIVLFIVLGVILAIITVVGHGIWVLFATVFGSKSQSGGGSSAPILQQQVCPRCRGAEVQLGAWCPLCQWPGSALQPEAIEGARSVRAIQSLQHLVRQQVDLGLLDSATADRLQEILQAREATLSAVPITDADAQAPAESARIDEHVKIPSELDELETSAPDAGDTSEAIPLAELVEAIRPEAAIRQRAEAYAAHKRSHALDRDEEADEAVAGQVRQEAVPLSRLLAAFMEERNIRWGELIGGLLIVGCSIALVLSFWSQIAERPILKFGVFNGVTAALFGAGLYVDRRLRLSNTGQGLLLIASILVPLNFLAIAAFTDSENVAWTVGGEVLSAIVFAVLLWLSGATLVGSLRAFMLPGVLVPSIFTLLTRRFIDADSSTLMLGGFALATLLPYVGLSGVAVKRVHVGVDESPDEVTVHRYYKWLGVVTFSALLPLGLLLVRSADAWGTVHRLSPMLGLLGAPALLTGAFAWRCICEKELANQRTAGVAVGVIGAVLLLVALVAAWPQPLALFVAALIASAVFYAIAVGLGIPLGHEVAAICLAVAWTLVGHVALGRIRWLNESSRFLSDQLLCAVTGWILLPFALALGVVAWAWQRAARQELTLGYARVAAIVGCFSLVSATVFGFGRVGDPDGMTWMYLLYAVALAMATVSTRNSVVAGALSLITAGAAVQGIVFLGGAPDGWLGMWPRGAHWGVALLLHGSVVTGIGALMRAQVPGILAVQRGFSWTLDAAAFRSAQSVLCGSAVVSAVLAQLVLLYWLPALSPRASCLFALWFALLAIALATILRSVEYGAVFQVYSVLAVCFGVHAGWSDLSWSQAPVGSWLEPPRLATVGIALSLWCVVWSAARFLAPSGWIRGLTGQSRLTKDAAAFLRSPWSGVDHVVYAALVLLLGSLAVYSAAPGALQELSPRPDNATARVVVSVEQFEIHIAQTRLAHHAARGASTWWFFAVSLIAGALGLRESAARWRAALVAVTIWSIIPLLATSWEPQVAVASALRWGLAGGMLAACVVVWGRGFLPPPAGLAFHAPAGSWEGHARVWRGAILALTFIPLLLLGAYVLAAAFVKAELDQDVLMLRLPFLVWTGMFLLFVGAAREIVARSPRAQSPSLMFRLRVFSGLGLLAGLAPTLVWLLYAVAVSLRQHPLTGPEPESVFVRMGLAASYAIPLFVMTVALVGTAIRERSQAYAFSGGWMLMLAVTAGFLLMLTRWGMTLDGVAWVCLAQWNALVAASYGAAWLGVRRISGSHREPAPLLVALLGFASLLCLLHLTIPTGTLLATPWDPSFAADAAHVVGWLSVAATIAVVAWLAAELAGVRVFVSWLLQAACLMAFVLLATLAVSRFDAGNWQAYHVLLGAWHAATIYLLVCSVRSRWKTSAQIAWPSILETLLGQLAVLVATVLALRALVQDPQAPWWGVAALVAGGVECALVSWRTARRKAVYVAGVLLNIAATAAWLEVDRSFDLLDLIYVNVAAATLPCILWLLLERGVFQPAEARSGRRPGVGLHRVAAAGALGVGILLAASGLALDLLGMPKPNHGPLVGATFASLAFAVTMTLWDPRARLVLFSLYLTGLLGFALLLDSFQLRGDLLHWTGTIFAAAYALATSFIANRRRTLVSILRSGRIPLTPRHCRRALRWISPVNIFVALFVVAMAYWTSFTFTGFTLRVTAAQAALVQALSVGLLAFGRRRSQLQSLSLLLGIVAAVPFGWIWVTPDMQALWLHRLVAVFVTMVVMSVFYSVGIVKLIRRENEWTRAAQSLVRVTVVLTAGALAALMAVETAYYRAGGVVPLHPAALTLTALTQCAFVVALLAAAIVPGRDPLKLKEPQRTVYVYAAEIMLSLLVLHLRLTMPWLFAGVFEKYWPLVVMLIAFIGVGLSEFFLRRRQFVLSTPLGNTGILLPILPVIGFWVAPPTRVDYSGMLLTAGALYTTLAATRRSFAFAMAAVAAVNASLWYLLYRVEGLSLAEHPQLWIIPPALCVLVASHLNAKQLGTDRIVGIRYLTSTFIYASSTADIFLNGVAQAPWLPIVLAGISLVGIFAGIWLRIRAFLYLGTSFLLVAIATVIWYAAVDLEQTWIWWVTGIVTGVLIIVLFAVFEKQRERVLKLVDDLKEWE